MKVFLSYRRSDSRAMAGRIAERLKSTPDIAEVFIDVDGIEPGEDFTRKIEAALRKSRICLVLIGDGWTGPRADGPDRIHEPDDFVRLEVARALASRATVIPVLLDGAPMPEPNSLPEDIRALTARNALFARHLSFDQDMTILIDRMFGRKAGGPLSRFARRRPVTAGLLRSALGFFAAVTALIVAAQVHNSVTGRALSETLGGAGVVTVLAGVILAAGLVLPNLLRRR
ncbi:MAG: toll/interleukin-1 receptor domain-containing protein [Oceanicaulis sp.]